MSPCSRSTRPGYKARSSFGAQLTSYQFADVALVSAALGAPRFQRTAQHIARSGIDNIGLTVYAEGDAPSTRKGAPAEEFMPDDVCFS